MTYDRRDYPPRAWWNELDEKTMTATFTDLDDEQHEVRVAWAVCGTCQGRGSHVNPSIDADHGITEDEMHELGDDFRTDYFGGAFDVECSECRGRRVVPELADSVDDALRAKIESCIDEDNDFNAMCAAERRMGC